MQRQTSALEQTIGRAAIRALAEKFPGQRIYVPWQNPEALARFQENFSPLVGVRGVRALVDAYGGLRILVPSDTKPKRGRGFIPLDLDMVVELTLQNLTAKQIAALMKCNPRSVHATRSRARSQGLLPRKRRKPRK